MVPSQVLLARLTGIDKNIINALENNRIFLSASYALLISETLGCRLDDLYEKKSIEDERNPHRGE